MIKETTTLIPEAHSVRVDFSDDFGHTHSIIYPTHIAVEDPALKFPNGPVTLTPFDPEQQLTNVRQMMADREQAFVEYCLADKELSRHPVIMAHPDHPQQKSPKVPL